MDTKGYGNIPQSLYDAITFLAQALPKRSVPTFLELLFGAMLTQNGFVTEAWLAIRPKRHWTSYFKWLQKGRWSWVALGLQTARLALQRTEGSRCYVAIDDTVVFRCSRKAPESRIHHQHGCKVNRPVYVRGQNWVTMALVLPQGWRSLALPILSRLSRSTGNSGKLVAAKTLLRVTRPLFHGRLVTLLVDSWYMRKSLLLPAQTLGYQVIGQVRKDTALYRPPPCHNGKRGRPRKYGDKLTAERVAELPMISQNLFLYGQWQTVHYRSCVARARFLDGQQVRAVWSQIENKDGTLRQPRLILSTDLSLSAARILLAYNRRWSIEDLFNQLKNRWGWKDTWQQTRQVLHRWTQILSTSYALPQLLAQQNSEQVKDLASLCPWRDKQPITAGRVRQGLQRIFGHVDIRSHWNPKSGKFSPQNRGKKPDRPPDPHKTA
ncbi:transposase [uncultured Desulfuromonas sp.]|uniref:IS701 family transposase n=1 Tax=uncultured Desulfuromonas sp. TaxID=181013 RepID=UPI002AAB829F|nr:transposase [uncultured Desulfuromonas sp.]